MCGLFLDIGRITATDRSQIIDLCAVRRQRDRLRHEIISVKSGFSGLYFDGKVDKTLQRECTLKNEKHITLLNVIIYGIFILKFPSSEQN